MADLDVDVLEFLGWLTTTARLEGWTAVRSESYGVAAGAVPDVILFRGSEVIAAKVKTSKGARASGTVDGLTARQDQVRAGITPSARYFVWTPEAAGEALDVLRGRESGTDLAGPSGSSPGALLADGAVR